MERMPLHLSVLVAGLLPGKSGKSCVALGLLAGLLNRGIKVGFFKPLATLDLYDDYLGVEVSYEEGVPIASELVALREFSLDVDDPNLINPVAVLTAPLKPESFIEARTPASYFSYSADLFRRTAIIKAVIYEPVKAVLAYVNQWAIDRKILEVDSGVIAKLTRRADEIVRINNLDDLRETYKRVSVRAVETAYEKLLGRHRVFIVEGYDNSAWPLPPHGDVDIVVTVAPGTALIYPGARYKAAVALKSGGSLIYLRRITTADIFTLISPAHVVKIPPFRPYDPLETRAEKMARLVDLIVSKFEE